MLGSGNTSNREGVTMSSDMPPLPHCLPLNPITLSSQKYTRSGEVRRVLGVSPGSTSEDHLFGRTYQKPPPVATEELKHFKESVKDASRKAQDRAKKFKDSIKKLDSYRVALNLKKQQTEDFSSTERSGGANLPKSGSQMHRHPQDIINQRVEDRSKGVGLNRRARMSMADIQQTDAKAVASQRQHMVAEKDGDVLPALSGTTIRIEEKIRRLPVGGEGWDKKMKRKRSVGSVGSRGITGDRDSKRAIQPKLSAEAKLRSCDLQAFRPKSSPGVSGINKLDGSFEDGSSNAAVFHRNELDHPLPLRERLVILEQRAMAKGNCRPKIHEDNRAGSLSMVLKGKESKAQRTGSLMVLDSSSKVHPSSGAFQGWEESSTVNKGPVLGMANNQKPPSSASSSPHAMAQWVGQRPHKNSRTRRANLISPVADSESQVSSQGFVTCDGRTSFEPNASLLNSSIDNKGSKIKREYEHISSPFGLSESEDSGAGESTLKKKRIDSGDGVLAVAHKVRLQTRKNKIPINANGDIGRKQGQSGSTSSVTRPTIHLTREKIESLPSARPLQNMRQASDKNRSKSGRPPSKKLKDRKASIRLGMLSNASSDFTGESDDDHEDIYAAARAARNADNLACSGPFWKKMEPLFASLDSDDMSYLKQQLSFAEELEEGLSQMFGVQYKGIFVHKEIYDPSSETQESHAQQGTAKTDLCGRFDADSVDKVTPLYQRVLSALIEEDEGEEFYHHGEGKNLSFHYASDDSHCGSCNQIDFEPKDREKMESEVESRVVFQSPKNCLLDRISCNKSAVSNTFTNPSMSSSMHSDEQWLGDGDLTQLDVGVVSEICSNDLSRLQTKASVPAYSSSECQYRLMGLDDKVLLELQSIGLYPEMLPGLAEGEEVLNQDVFELKEGLFQQTVKKKKTLRKIDKAIQKVRSSEKRKLEHAAMDQLIEMAYRKRMVYRGSHGSRTGVRKVSKQTALAFIKRTLVRCQKFEDTGSSCFNDSALQNILFSSPRCSSDAKSADGFGSGTASNTCNEASNLQTEARGSGVVSSALERCDTQSDNIDQGSSDVSRAGVLRHGILLNKGKKEAPTDDVVASASSGVTSTLENTSLGGGRGKRDNFRGNYASVSIQASAESLMNERNTKAKSRHRQNNNPSTSGNRDPGRFTTSGSNSSAANDATSGKGGREVRLSSLPGNVHVESSKDAKDPIDFPFDSVELGVSSDLGGPQDLSSWLNFDEDGLQDHDSIGLEIPMDDLSDLNMIL